MVHVLIRAKKQKCSKCGNEVYTLIDWEPFCLKHYVKDYYGKHEGCMEAYLDMLAEAVMEGKKLNSDEVKLLKEIKKHFPKTAKEFPRLFEKIK